MQFNSFIGIDYSGAATPATRSTTIQVYQAAGGTGPQAVASPSSTNHRKRNWNRIEVVDWLTENLQVNSAVMIGIDHAFSFPLSYFQRYNIATWDEFLNDFVDHWPTHRIDATVEQYRKNSNRTGNADEFRLTERWTSSAKSVFQFDVQGSVSKSTHAGLPLLRKLRQNHPQLHFWPYDGWQIPAGRSVVAEVYPSIFRKRYPRKSRSCDQQDAYAVCQWLREMNSAGRLSQYFDPPLEDKQKAVSILEGWILGVW